MFFPSSSLWTSQVSGPSICSLAWPPSPQPSCCSGPILTCPQPSAAPPALWGREWPRPPGSPAQSHPVGRESGGWVGSEVTLLLSTDSSLTSALLPATSSLSILSASPPRPPRWPCLTSFISALWSACCTGPGTRSNKSAHNSSNSARVTFALKSTSSIRPSIWERNRKVRALTQVLLSGWVGQTPRGQDTGRQAESMGTRDGPPQNRAQGGGVLHPMVGGGKSLPSSSRVWAPGPCDRHWRSERSSVDWPHAAAWPWHEGSLARPLLSDPCAAHWKARPGAHAGGAPSPGPPGYGQTCAGKGRGTSVRNTRGPFIHTGTWLSPTRLTPLSHSPSGHLFNCNYYASNYVFVSGNTIVRRKKKDRVPAIKQFIIEQSTTLWNFSNPLCYNRQTDDATRT